MKNEQKIHIVEIDKSTAEFRHVLEQNIFEYTLSVPLMSGLSFWLLPYEINLSKPHFLCHNQQAKNIVLMAQVLEIEHWLNWRNWHSLNAEFLRIIWNIKKFWGMWNERILWTSFRRHAYFVLLHSLLLLKMYVIWCFRILYFLNKISTLL